MSIFGEETISASGEETVEAGQETTLEVAASEVEQPEQEEQPIESNPASGEDEADTDEKEAVSASTITAEQLAQGYLGLERAAQQAHQTKQQPPASPVGSAEDPNEVVLNMLAQDPIGTIQYFIDQAIAPERERNQAVALSRNLETIMAQYPKQMDAEGGAQALYSKVSEIAKELGNPQLARNPSVRLLRMAAEECWGAETKQQAYNKAKAAAREEVEANRRSKRGLQAPGGAKSSKEQTKSEADMIKESILSISPSGIFG